MSFWSDPVSFLMAWLRGLLASTGLAPEWVQFILSAVGAVLLPIMAMLFVIFLIWFERKFGGRVQDRLGPNRIGPWGIFQPIADMLKIFTKEYITPEGVDWVPYNLAPVLAVGAVLMIWAVIPFTATVVGANLDVGILYVVAVAALGELGIMLAGWGSNNKFALLGAFRAVAQLISYEIPMLVSLLVPVMLAGSMGMNGIVKAQTVPFILLSPVAALVYFITSIAENSRAPFDLMEADSELVAGINTEYSGLKFGMFYVGDFLHAFTLALVFTTIFLGGWSGPGAETYPILGFFYFAIKTAIMYMFGLLVRFSLPRFRIDQMMNISWKLLTPLALVNFMMMSVAIKAIEGLPLPVQVVALLGMNALILVAASQILGRVEKRQKKARYTAAPRPIAVADRVSNQS